MTELPDLERFFRQVVRNLAATDPARLHRPLPLADIRDSIVPYRANRRALQLESSEDYELVLMRLCAGEGGFARTEPDVMRALFAAELRSSNPDLRILHQHQNAVVILANATRNRGRLASLRELWRTGERHLASGSLGEDLWCSWA